MDKKRFILFSALGLSLILIFSIASTVDATGMIAAVKVGLQPWGVASAPDKGEIFVTNHSNGSVSVIADMNHTVVATIPLGKTPSGIAYDSGKGAIYVTHPEDDAVSVISDRTKTVTATISVGRTPLEATYDSDKGEIYVTNWGDNTVSVISDSSNTVIATISVEKRPMGITYDSNKSEIFVVNQNSPPNLGAVSVISDITKSVIATISVGLFPKEAVYDSGKGEVYVTNSGDQTVSVISDLTNTVTAKIPVGAPTNFVDYAPDKGEIFVSTTDSNFIALISDTNHTLIKKVSLGQFDGYGLTYDINLNEIFIANNSYAVRNGWSIEYLPDNYYVYVLSLAPDLVTPLLSVSTSNVILGHAVTLKCNNLTTGTPPYMYRWFSKAPNLSDYSPIEDSNASSYNFVISAPMTTGNWSFMLQITDATGASVNSTATSVYVGTQATNVSYAMISLLIVILIAAIIIAAFIIVIKARKTG